jgi:steroid delta-isomerase-like uncharacterized protein
LDIVTVSTAETPRKAEEGDHRVGRESNRGYDEVMELRTFRYWHEGEDIVFTLMATGQEYRGREGVSQMFEYFYRDAFDARAESSKLVVADGIAVFEGDFVGEHIGEFAGIPATNKPVRVPLCVVYDLENDEIKRGRIYFEMPVLVHQLGLETAS